VAVVSTYAVTFVPTVAISVKVADEFRRRSIRKPVSFVALSFQLKLSWAATAGVAAKRGTLTAVRWIQINAERQVPMTASP
jgi:hypothetical protein